MARLSLPPSGYSSFSLRRASVRLTLSLASGVITYFAMVSFGPPVRVVASWDMAAFVLLSLSWQFMLRATAAQTKRRAASQDPGRTTVWILVTLSSTLSLFAAAVVLRQAHTLARNQAILWVALCLIAVLASWLLSHTSWTLRYAHLYYRDDKHGVGGLSFPCDAGKRPEPNDIDFAYFAFTVGMCFQVSDVTVTNTDMRRAVLVHACQSFAYNTAIVALALNIAFGFLS